MDDEYVIQARGIGCAILLIVPILMFAAGMLVGALLP